MLVDTILSSWMFPPERSSQVQVQVSTQRTHWDLLCSCRNCKMNSLQFFREWTCQAGTAENQAGLVWWWWAFWTMALPYRRSVQTTSISGEIAHMENSPICTVTLSPPQGVSFVIITSKINYYIQNQLLMLQLQLKRNKIYSDVMSNLNQILIKIIKVFMLQTSHRTALNQPSWVTLHTLINSNNTVCTFIKLLLWI